VVAAVEYTLYPAATVPQMVDELLLALAWTFAHIDQHGGEPRGAHAPPVLAAGPPAACAGRRVRRRQPSRRAVRARSRRWPPPPPLPADVSVVGHSAGAHLAVMAVLHHAANVEQDRRLVRSCRQAFGAAGSRGQQEGLERPIVPAACIGICGVYELSKVRRCCHS
jgi:hypothetical protein